MNERFSHLVWLGAGTATEPENLIDHAEQVTLFEAREAACLSLQLHYSTANIIVKQMVLTAEGTPVEFTEYSLAEYSAVQAVAGLKALFPGIKRRHSEQVKSIAVTEAIDALALENNNNVLVVDIADSNLALLSALQQKNQLKNFSEIHIQAGLEPLYAGAATAAEITTFLQEQGYLLQQTNSSDPDLPWITFGINPLWQTLRQAQQTSKVLNNELEEVKRQLTAAQHGLATGKQQVEQATMEASKQAESAKQQLEQLTQQLNKKMSEHEALQQLFSTTKTAAEINQTDLTARIASIDAELKKSQQQLASVNAQAIASKQTAQQQETRINELNSALATANKARPQAEQQLGQLTQQLNKKMAEHEALQQLFSTTKTAAEKNQADLTARIATIDAELKKSQQQLASVNAQAIASKQAAQQQEARIDKINSALATANNARQEAEQQLAKAQQELAQVTTQMRQHQTENDLQKAFEQTMQKILAEQTQKLTKEVSGLKNHINTGLGNTAKQVEAFMGVQNYLEKGIKPLSFHGWPISPDIGLYIVGLIDANNYDVIIEFGSGTSTVLMAKALISKQRSIQTKALGRASQSTEITMQENSFTDLPARIVTFEHNSLYHGKTTQALQENGIDHLVDLVHAPLVDYQYKDGSQYLYYNCNDKLQELARIFKGRKANILVLVDGPPGATNKNARFPALPHLLNTLPEHSLTVVMDDYNRAEEKEIVELWKKILSERGIDLKFETIPSEKGLSVLTTNQLE